ncbi:hypothetical protein [Halovivax sp.]|uniref:hypothetical protein n=1 Tax=Halovivax sp. TaxID=1935978 RepID=UPI0025C7276C|nr:hypothetical protein [Halovivax sp.]
MAIRKLLKMGGSIGITLPKGEVEREGLLDENGEFVDEFHAQVRQEADREWSIEVFDEIGD